MYVAPRTAPHRSSAPARRMIFISNTELLALVPLLYSNYDTQPSSQLYACHQRALVTLYHVSTAGLRRSITGQDYNGLTGEFQVTTLLSSSALFIVLTSGRQSCSSAVPRPLIYADLVPPSLIYADLCLRNQNNSSHVHHGDKVDANFDRPDRCK
jgi:hypothetical protein